MKALGFLSCTIALSLLISCATNPGQDALGYCNAATLKEKHPVYKLIENPQSWYLQYPGGIKQMEADITPRFKSKYLYAETDEEGNEWMVFTLHAADQGKSTNGSNVRTEITHLRKPWNFTNDTSFECTFKLFSADFDIGKYTIMQMKRHNSTGKLADYPIVRIEERFGRLNAIVINYMPDGVTRADGIVHTYPLGEVEENQETTIRMETDKRRLQIYRDGTLLVTHVFPEEMDISIPTYYRTGLYYQTKPGTDILTEVHVRNMKETVTKRK